MKTKGIYATLAPSPYQQWYVGKSITNKRSSKYRNNAWHKLHTLTPKEHDEGEETKGSEPKAKEREPPQAKGSEPKAKEREPASARAATKYEEFFSKST